MIKYKNIILIAFFVCLSTQTYAQLHKYTKVDKIARHTYNFIDNANCKGKQKKDKGTYIVYSDRVNNNAYLDPLGLKQTEKQEFLTPYYVVNEDGNFLELVSLDPTLIGKPKGMFSFLFGSKYNFKDAKNVTYIGWVHRDNLLHFSHPKISEKNFRPIQYMLGFKDVKTLFDYNNFVKKDTVFIYKDPKFKTKSDKNLSTNQFVYLYKYNANKTAALISNIENMHAEDSVQRKMGWVSAKLITPIGQRGVYHVKEQDSLQFKATTDSIHKDFIDNKEIAKSFVFKNIDNCATTANDSTSTSVILPINIWNHYDNKLINVKGNDLLIRKVSTIKKDNKTVNFHFIFDCNPKLRDKLLLQITSLQRIWLLISQDEKFKNLSFTFSASSYGCGGFYDLPKTDSFALWVDYLQKVFLEDPSIKSIETNTEGITKCFEYALQSSNHSPSFENNIFLIAGEDRLKLPTVKSGDFYYISKKFYDVTEELAKTSSRFLFYQLENSPKSTHQDYILQAKRILDTIGNSYSKFLKDYTVENRLVKKQNVFTTIPSQDDNIYLYDAPKNSLYNGGIVFPKANRTLTPVSFDVALDSLLSKTFTFNTIFLESLENNIAELGFLRSKPGKRIIQLLEKDNVYKKLSALIPRNQMFEQYFENGTINLKENQKLTAGYLFTKNEFEIIVENYKSIIPIAEKLIKRRNRKKLLRVYKKSVKSLNRLLFYKELTKRETIAELLYVKTGIPVKDSVLSTLRIKDVKRKKYLSNEEFTEHMALLRAKINSLETILNNKNTKTFKDGSKATYYFIPEENLL